MVRVSKVVEQLKAIQRSHGGSFSYKQLREAIYELRGSEERTVQHWITVFRQVGLKENAGKFWFDDEDDNKQLAAAQNLPFFAANSK